MKTFAARIDRGAGGRLRPTAPRLFRARGVSFFAAAVALALAVTISGDARAPAAPSIDVRTPAGTGGPSIYALDLALVDQHGRTLALSDLRGRPLVASMIYTTCASVCPSVTGQLRELERLLAGEVRRDVTFVLFSLDPGRDTPAALAAFAATHELDPVRWRLLATSETNVRTLSAVLGVSYRAEAPGDIGHSVVVAVIDRDGVIRHRQVGLERDIDALARAIEAAR